MTTNAIPNIPIPHGVIEVGDWEADPRGHRVRSLLWSTFGDGAVQVDGRQHADGTVDVVTTVYVGDGQALDAAQARQLAAALLNAADELDELL